MTNPEYGPAGFEGAIIISMDDPEVTADIACETALNALDQLMVLAARQETQHLVWANKIFLGQIKVRTDLIASLLLGMEQQAGKLRMVRNG